MSGAEPEDFAGSRERWLAGLCPCCGAELDWWPSAEPQAVAEGVTLCSYCGELSVYQARDEDERRARADYQRLERHARRAQAALFLAAVWIAAAVVWVAALRA